MTDSLAALTPLLACPACGSATAPLSTRAVGLACRDCGARFPVHDNGAARVPWLFADAGATLTEWQARLNGFLNDNAAEQARLQVALEDQFVGKTGRKRIRRLLHARREQRDQVTEILAPLRLDTGGGTAQHAATSLDHKLPKSLGLTNYYANVFRDWAWQNGENEQLAAAIADALARSGTERLGKTLTLGAGACRLAYDLHRAYSPDLSVALDLNPLFLFLASRVMRGEVVPLWEFPVAPLNDAAFTALQECRAPEPLGVAQDDFMFVCADGMNPPFSAGSFDTVVTPWLIDVIPQNLREFIPRINRLLKRGGTWLNTGSLAFFHKNESWCYSQEEVLELLTDNGFEVKSATRSDIPYLQSPLSAHKRMESVFSFSVTKRRDAELPRRYEYLPDWMLDTTRPIPELTEFVIESSKHLLQTQTLAAIDGERTIDEIGRLVAKQYGLQVDDATHAVKRILVDVYERAVV